MTTSRFRGLCLAGLLLTLAACSQPQPAPAPDLSRSAVAIFAGGCFWCVEQDFEKLEGVLEAESGYIGGFLPNPTYDEVSSGYSGHTEAVRVYYDPGRISYARLVDYFWRHIDPTVRDRQFCDRGTQYRSGIYWLDAEQRSIAEASREALVGSGRFPAVHTEVLAAGNFWPAEAYHQNYYKRNPLRYAFYRQACGRDARVEQLWGKASP